MKSQKKKRRISFASVSGNESFPNIGQEETLKNTENEKIYSESKRKPDMPSAIVPYLAKWIGNIYSTLTERIKPDYPEIPHPVRGSLSIPDKPDTISGTNAEARILEKAEEPSDPLYRRGNYSKSEKKTDVASAIMPYLTKWIGNIYSTLTERIKPDYPEIPHPVKDELNIPDTLETISGSNAEARILGKAEGPSDPLYHRGNFSNPDSMNPQLVSEETFHKMLELASESHKVLQDLYTATKEIHRELTE